MKSALLVALLAAAHVVVMLLALEAEIWAVGTLNGWAFMAFSLAVFATASFAFDALWRGPLPGSIEECINES